MSEPRLIVEQQGRILVMRFSNPGARNALHPDMYVSGLDALRHASADDSIRAAVLTGVDGFFCAGGNLNRLRENRLKTPEAQRESIEHLHDWVRALRSCPKPVVAGVDGAAAGAGMSLALACDMIVAGRGAKFVMAYVKAGLSPDGGGTWSLARVLPRPLVNELTMLGEPILGERLHALGVVNRIVDDGKADQAAIELANRIAAGPRRAIGRIKQLVDAAGENDLRAHLDAEREAFVASLFDAEAGAGIDAFLNKRAPDFS
jgi:enoyl-CoA hydratase/carnithine racemase